MRELIKSAFTLPWALSMVGAQQLVNLVAPPAEGRIAGATASLDAVSQAAERQLDGWLDEALEIGDRMRRGLADLTALRPPSLDSSGLMRLATDRRLAALVQTTSDYGLMPAARIDARRLAPEDASAALQELTNKLRILNLIVQMPADLDLNRDDERPLPVLLERAAAFDAARRVWAVEALGTHAGDRALHQSGGADPQDVLTDEAAAALPPWSLTMLHAGLGISFATLVLAPLDPSSSPDLLRHAINRFAALCRRSARRGCVGASLEALGFVARALHRSLVPLLAREIQRADPGLREYFWHGVGRALYADPAYAWPSSNAPRRMIADLALETQDPLGYRNALSGLAWETTAVNLQNPEVMEFVLRYHGVLAADNDAFANGVCSALVVQHDTVPDDPHITAFVSHEPRTLAAAEAWRAVVTIPCHIALERTYDELRQSWAMDRMFRYRPGSA